MIEITIFRLVTIGLPTVTHFDEELLDISHFIRISIDPKKSSNKSPKIVVQLNLFIKDHVFDSDLMSLLLQ